jgi:hypothetical protein
MSKLTSLTLACCVAWSVAACSGGLPKPLSPDGLHRVPVNRIQPVPGTPVTTPVASEPSASPDAGDRP